MSLSIVITYSLLFISLYFEVFLLVSFVARVMRPRSANDTTTPDTSLPSVAIIVPCFNEESGIAETLRSLLALDYPSNRLQLIVVDDGSTDATLSIARGFESDTVKVFTKVNGGKHTAMNFGLAQTDAELVGCLDADSTVAPQALRSIASIFTDTRVGAVTPAIHVKEPGNILQHMQKAEYRISLFSRFMLAHLGSAFITPGPFSIYRTAVVREVGGWRYAHSTEDMEMALRIQDKGFLIANAPEATVHTMTPRTVRALVKQRTRWAYGGMRNLMDFRHMIGNTAYGNLGLFVLPFSVLSIGTGMYFFFRLLHGFAAEIAQAYDRYVVTHVLPHPSLSFFYINTSMMWFLVIFAIMLILAVISAGSWIGTGRSRMPVGTVFFLILYSFIAPIWLFTALWRVIRGGVAWR